MGRLSAACFWYLGEISVRTISLSASILSKKIGNTDKQVFPSLEFIGWYSVAPRPTASHIALHEQVCLHPHLITSSAVQHRFSSSTTLQRLFCSFSGHPLVLYRRL